MVFKVKKKLAFTVDLIKSGRARDVWKAFARRIGSEELAFGFKRDLSLEYAKPRSLTKVSVREFRPGDELYFKERKNDGLINEFQTCYVAVTQEDIPCFHLWLIDASQNGKLKKAWGNTFPTLKPDEFLVENVYTVPKYRGAGIFPTILHDIGEKSRGLGAKYLLSFGEVSNVNMSRSLVYAGFQPYILRKKRWFLFVKSITFEEIPAKLMADFNKYTAAYRPKPILENNS